ncbi:MAG TPA: hypothetical protein PKA12_09845 [Saprospiraceae bacterium]|nr:hypothetical protein [Saprospiraceae bacterium]
MLNSWTLDRQNVKGSPHISPLHTVTCCASPCCITGQVTHILPAKRNATLLHATNEKCPPRSYCQQEMPPSFLLPTIPATFLHAANEISFTP